MRHFWVLLLLAFAWSAAAQEEAVLRAAKYLSGAASAEEIPSWWVEQLEAQPRIRINGARLRPGLLLSEYQVACILDYRSRSGDILSWEELALVDGFSAECVAALRPFLSLESTRLPGAADTVRTHATALVRSTLNNVGGKAKAMGESWRAGAAYRAKDGCLYADVNLRSLRVVAGDFHTRWGQGLASWTGFRMESLSTVDAFVKRASGLSPAWSYSSEQSLRGVACEWAAGPFSTTGYVARDGSFGLHGEYLWRKGQLGFTALSGGAFSLDGRYGRRGLNWAGEVAFGRRSLAVQTAVRGQAGESWNWALQGRAIPSRYSGKKYGEYALGGGMNCRARGRHALSLTADAALLPLTGVDPRRFQLRVYGGWQWTLSEAWMLDLRFTERYRNYEAARTDFRLDVKRASGPWLGVWRAEAARCGSWGFLTYYEKGYKTDKTAAYLRLTGFSIKDWSARIYCYERDAPGSFSVPAYNGRGFSASLVASHKWRIGRLRLKANLRAAWTARQDHRPAPVMNLQFQGDY